MVDRRSTVLDAAIEALGTKGMRGLTHRAVDQAAGLPPGSTSNLFRSRDDLLAGIVERFAQRERAAFERFALSDVPLRPEDLGRTLARFAVESTRGGRSVTLARYALLVEGAIRPAVQRTLADAGATVNGWAIQWLRVVGSPHPELDWGVLANYVTGLVLHELAHPSEDFDPVDRIAALVGILVEAP
jgi:DNA-binding transcriptional regulator YbjK